MMFQPVIEHLEKRFIKRITGLEKPHVKRMGNCWACVQYGKRAAGTGDTPLEAYQDFIQFNKN